MSQLHLVFITTLFGSLSGTGLNERYKLKLNTSPVKMDFCFSGVCYEKKLLVVPVNTSFLAEVTYTELQNCLFCFSLSHPFKREVTKRKLVPIFRLENVTKVVSQPGCCEGWARAKKVAQEIECEPVCSEGCGQESQGGHGTCSAPFTCSCDPGWTGAGCDTQETCPPGTWGHQCNNTCLCVNGAFCNQES